MDVSDRGYVANWVVVGPLLQQMERQDLRNYSEADRQRDIQALLDMPVNAVTVGLSGADQHRHARRSQR
jgi:hypothetical protein